MCFQNLPPNAPAIDYALAGQPAATFLAPGRAILTGVMVAVPGQQPRFHEDVRGVLAALGDRPRIYYDARLALAVELQHDLPFAPSYDDVRAAPGPLAAAATPSTRPGRSRVQRVPWSE